MRARRRFRLLALRTLWLNGTAVSDAGMTHLTGCSQVSIQIGQTKVGDAGLLVLAAIPTLTSISASRSLVTAEGVAAAMEVPGRNEALRISN
ncbi:MAG: hypothetical protein IPF96_20750 [Rhodobacter sp.]|nr:hypothetical protein [Rhodobacter sp.]